jgi:cobalt/nickel transport system ATP-binding protein
MRDSIIRLKGISFSYDIKDVLKDLDLEINQGDRIGLVGPNGSGKTTLLYIIMGILKPSAGTIEILGKLKRGDKDFIEARRKIGLLFQDPDNQLFCPTVKEDVAFGPMNLGKTRQEAIKIVEEVLEILGIRHLEDRVTYKLSHGEKRLVALGTIIAMNPICYLLDEPSAGLDDFTTERVLNYLRCNAETYLIVSHDREFIRRATDKVYFLSNGRISEGTI